MGAALYIVLERGDLGFETYMNGKALSQAGPVLDRIARELPVTPLMAFYSVPPPESSSHGESPSSIGPAFHIAAAQWFDTSEGLATVRALRDYVHQNPQSFVQAVAVHSDLEERFGCTPSLPMPTIDVPEAVQRDLEAFEHVLQAAQERRLRWHLSVGY